MTELPTPNAGEPVPEPPVDVTQDVDSTQYLVSDARHDPASAAWGGLSRKIERFVKVQFSRRPLPPGMEFEDFYMEVMARVLQKVSNYDPDRHGVFWAWLHQVASHLLIDLRRRSQAQRRGGEVQVVQQQPETEGADLIDQLAATASGSPTVQARTQELADAEMKCAQQLGAESRSVYLLRRRDGLAYQDIALFLGRDNPATVRSTFKRAREQVIACLRSKLDAYAHTADRG